jgi:8-oxo-dGTP pyrophosphatase MutT (NUDIX family)
MEEIKSAGILFYRYVRGYPEVLLVNRIGELTIPAGKLNKGEKRIQGAIRETSEELGCTTNKYFIESLEERFNYYYKAIIIKESKQIIYMIQYNFRVDIFKINDETTEAFWVPFEEILSLSLRDYIRCAFENYFNIFLHSMVNTKSKICTCDKKTCDYAHSFEEFVPTKCKYIRCNYQNCKFKHAYETKTEYCNKLNVFPKNKKRKRETSLTSSPT